MSGAGNPLGYDYRDPHHVERYGKLVVRNPDGSTEGKHPRDADVDVMREIHDPAPLLRVIRVKCIDCSGGSESEARKCTAIGCALWPYRMASNPFHAPREMTPEQREAGAARLAAARARAQQSSGMAAPVAEHSNYQGKNEPTPHPRACSSFGFRLHEPVWNLHVLPSEQFCTDTTRSPPYPQCRVRMIVHPGSSAGERSRSSARAPKSW